MAESMKDYETELEASFKKIEEGDILTGTVISVDEKEVVVDLKYYAEGIIPAEDYSREPGFSLKEQVNVGDEVSATVVSKDDGNGNILLSRTEAADVLAWDKLKELKDSKEVIDVVVKGIVNGGVIAYVEGVRGFIPASKLALNYVEDTNEYLNKPIQVQVFDIDKEKGRLILSAKEILREKAEEERKTKISNVQVGLVTEGVVESLQPYGAFVDLGNGLSGLVHISQICEKRIKKPSEVLTVGDKVKVKVTAVKDGKLSLSIKEATDMMAKEIEEEVIEDTEYEEMFVPEQETIVSGELPDENPVEGNEEFQISTLESGTMFFAGTVYADRDQCIAIRVNIMPAGQTVCYGIMTPDEKLWYVYAIDSGTHNFRISNSGNYKIFVKNVSTGDVDLEGGYVSY